MASMDCFTLRPHFVGAKLGTKLNLKIPDRVHAAAFLSLFTACTTTSLITGDVKLFPNPASKSTTAWRVLNTFMIWSIRGKVRGRVLLTQLFSYQLVLVKCKVCTDTDVYLCLPWELPYSLCCEDIVAHTIVHWCLERHLFLLRIQWYFVLYAHRYTPAILDYFTSHFGMELRSYQNGRGTTHMPSMLQCCHLFSNKIKAATSSSNSLLLQCCHHCNPSEHPSSCNCLFGSWYPSSVYLGRGLQETGEGQNCTLWISDIMGKNLMNLYLLVGSNGGYITVGPMEVVVIQRKTNTCLWYVCQIPKKLLLSQCHHAKTLGHP